MLLHERAAHELRALCQGILHDTDAVRRIARFDTARDPGGALAFASLLLLADREEGAQFWLQFAAGGGQATGAICLYLMHLRRGEWRDAKYWARQIEALEGNLASTPLSRTRSSTPPPALPARMAP